MSVCEYDPADGTPPQVYEREPSFPPEPSPWETVLKAYRMIEYARPSLLVNPADFDRVLAAAGGKPINVYRSADVEPGTMIQMPSLDSLWGR